MDVTAHPQDHPGEPEKFEKVWAEGNFALRNLVMKNDEEIVRAYSMASYPAEGKKSDVKCSSCCSTMGQRKKFLGRY
jgi:Na+-transporting NADH:ubiquinone oxidoreductase subunit F